MPRSRSEIEISLDTMPTIEIGNRVRRDLPAVLDEEVVVLPLADVDAAAAAADDHAGVRLAERRPASIHASRAAITPMSAARE